MQEARLVARAAVVLLAPPYVVTQVIKRPDAHRFEPGDARPALHFRSGQPYRFSALQHGVIRL